MTKLDPCLREYDRVIREERRAVVLARPYHVYGLLW